MRRGAKTGRRKYCVVVNSDHLDDSSDVVADIYPDFESAVKGTIEWAKQRMSYRRGSKYSAKWWLPLNAWKKAETKLRENHFLRIYAIYCKENREYAFDDDGGEVTMSCDNYIDWVLQPDTGVSR